MRRFFSALVVLASFFVPMARADAQVTLAQDTLSMDSPAAALCGFCGGEGFGVVFRELPAPARGLLAEDFPLTLRSVEIALGAARLDGTMCMNVPEGGTVAVDVEIWAGVTPPGASIGATMPGEAWPGTGEELVFAATDVPIELSIPASGATGFNLQLNRFDVVDEMGMPLRIADTFRYLRVFVQLHDSTLPGPSCPFSSDGSPLRDDGRIAEQRSYILANGMGFVWNEDARVGGDWAVRLDIVPSIPPATDAGPRSDAGARDAGASTSDVGASDGGAGAADAGGGGSGGGCGCRVSSSAPRWGAWASLGMAMALLGRRARRRR
ncbi:MAG: hypothetical protein K1X94_18855 [Sandaracinaceae bacterium]|nr:hypothetical protein [Sandaracinaceae bacterium]